MLSDEANNAAADALANKQTQLIYLRISAPLHHRVIHLHRLILQVFFSLLSRPRIPTPHCMKKKSVAPEHIVYVVDNIAR